MKITPQQLKALNVYCKLLADAYRDAGLDVRTVLRNDIEIPWNQGMVKELIWRPVKKVVTGEQSTKDIYSDDVTMIYDIVNRHSSTKGVSILFPSEKTKND